MTNEIRLEQFRNFASNFLQSPIFSKSWRGKTVQVVCWGLTAATLYFLITRIFFQKKPPNTSLPASPASTNSSPTSVETQNPQILTNTSSPTNPVSKANRPIVVVEEHTKPSTLNSTPPTNTVSTTNILPPLPSISIKKQELESLRQKDPVNYPPYLDDLLNSDYIQLYDHLLSMKSFSTRNEREADIEALSFSMMSHIVLQTKGAIVEKVSRLIPSGKNNVLFLVGGTGAGKSTTLAYLRGDKMVLKEYNYESQNDQTQLIGHGSTSCTFLPTVEVMDDLVIVDFPGFEDSNGPLVGLGMEYALKNLISAYNSKVLVIESITNVEGKFANAKKLAERLTRLIENKNECFLGITKYSMDPDYIKILAIEMQKKTTISQPSKQEIALGAKIQTYEAACRLCPEKEKELRGEIEDLQKELSKLESTRKKGELSSLQELDLQIINYQNNLKTLEQELLQQIGLKTIIPFRELEKPGSSTKILKTFSDSTNPTIRINSKKPLDVSDEELLTHLFKTDLKQAIQNQNDFDDQYKDIKRFEEDVLKSSLINIIFFKTNPEIGKFLHAPETDPKIALNYDKKIVDDCIKIYINFLLNSLDISWFKKIIERVKANCDPSQVSAFEEKFHNLLRFVLGLLGTNLSAAKNDLALEVLWEKELKSSAGVNFKVAPWVTTLLCPSQKNPQEISLLDTKINNPNIRKETFNSLIDEACQNLNQIVLTLASLKNLERLIEIRKKRLSSDT